MQEQYDLHYFSFSILLESYDVEGCTRSLIACGCSVPCENLDRGIMRPAQSAFRHGRNSIFINISESPTAGRAAHILAADSANLFRGLGRSRLRPPQMDPGFPKAIDPSSVRNKIGVPRTLTAGSNCGEYK